MANYHYDEGGNMVAYFLISFLALILIPTSLSLLSSSKKTPTDGCQCQPCVDKRKHLQKLESGSLLNPKLSKKATFTILGWSVLAYLIFRAGNATRENKVYDPFEILGIRAGLTEKEIKSHFKKLSKLYHPDKVAASGNNTIEAIANKFVEITKAYKSLTDETIRKNWEIYGHPDGRQETTFGLALPPWIIEGKNNIWVLGLYGLIFGGALPALVGRWWFGSRQKTKDGVNALTAASFFKSLKEESDITDVVSSLGKAFEWESPKKFESSNRGELKELEKKVAEKVGGKWKEIMRLVSGKDAKKTQKAIVLVYAHLLRLPISSASLKKEQADVLLQTPTLLNALLTVATSRNWLAPTLAIMQLHACLAQALVPGTQNLEFAQLPGIQEQDLQLLSKDAHGLEEFVNVMAKRGDDRTNDIKKAIRTWGRLELVDASFKVIGERLVTPSAIVFLVVKLRLSPPRDTPVDETSEEKDVDETKRSIKMNDEADYQFLTGKKDAEDLVNRDTTSGWAHAPYWPANRKPGWWLLLADDKSNKIVVPPMKISDIPFSDQHQDRNYRSYKLQFQAPGTVGLFTWKLRLISDNFVGEEISQDIALKIDDVSALNEDERGAEDEISEPEEDTLAGQMAAMRGGAVKKRHADSDEESSTDDDQESSSSSDSDSD